MTKGAALPPPPVILPSLPSGWVSGEGRVTPAVVKKARETLGLGFTYGQGRVLEVDSRVFAFRVEPHFDNHPKLKPGQRATDPDAPPPYWHPGVSVWERIDPRAAFPALLQNLLPRSDAGRIGLFAAALLVLGMAFAVRRISEAT